MIVIGERLDHSRLFAFPVCRKLRGKRFGAVVRKVRNLLLVVRHCRIELLLLGLDVVERPVYRRLVLLRLLDLTVQCGDLALSALIVVDSQ